jgi:hypothetical protein
MVHNMKEIEKITKDMITIKKNDYDNNKYN